MSNSFIDAETVHVEQKQETQEEYVDIYSLICFSPYQHQERKEQVDMANKYRQGLDSISVSEEDQNNDNCFLWNFFSPRLVYEGDLCGTKKGKVVESHKIFIDCSSTADQLILNNEDVHEIIKRAECEIGRILEKYHYKAKYVTLHVAVYSFTLTEDIANCFLYSVYPSNQFYPEDNGLCLFFVEENYSQLLKKYHDVGMDIEIEYVLVYDTEPFLQTDRPIADISEETHFLKGKITKEHIPSSNTSESEETPKPKPVLPPTPPPLPEPNYDSQSQLFEIGISYNKYLGPVYEPEGNWRWRIWSDTLHEISKNSADAFGVLGTIGLGVAAIAGIAILVVGAAPVLVATASTALVFAGGMGAASFASSLVNGYTYLIIDYYIEQDESAQRKALNVFGKELIWEGVSRGMGHIGKSVIGRITRRKINQYGTEQETVNREIAVNRGKSNRTQQKLENNIQAGEAIGHRNNELTRRQNYLNNYNELRKIKRQLKHNEREMCENLSDYNRLNNRFEQLNREGDALRKDSNAIQESITRWESIDDLSQPPRPSIFSKDNSGGSIVGAEVKEEIKNAIGGEDDEWIRGHSILDDNQ